VASGVNGYLFDPEEEDFGAIAATQRLLEQQQERETMPVWKQNAGDGQQPHASSYYQAVLSCGQGEWEKAIFLPSVTPPCPLLLAPRCYGKDLRQFAVAFRTFQLFPEIPNLYDSSGESFPAVSKLHIADPLGKFLQIRIENQVFWLDLTVVAAARIYKIRPVCHRSLLVQISYGISAEAEWLTTPKVNENFHVGKHLFVAAFLLDWPECCFYYILAYSSMSHNCLNSSYIIQVGS